MSFDLTADHLFFSVARRCTHGSKAGGLRWQSAASNLRGNSLEAALERSVEMPDVRSLVISSQIGTGTERPSRTAATVVAAVTAVEGVGRERTFAAFELVTFELEAFEEVATLELSEDVWGLSWYCRRRLRSGAGHSSIILNSSSLLLSSPLRIN